MVNEYRVVYDAVRGPIGEPKAYSERRAEFEGEEEGLEKIDVSIPYRMAPILPMDHEEDGEETQGTCTQSKLNYRDKRLLEVDNPEEDVKNPFANSFADPYL